MAEPDVTLTDYLVVLECLFFAARLAPLRSSNAAARHALVGIFLSLAFAAALGGIVHGFLSPDNGFAYQAVWACALIALGAAAWGEWAVFAWTSFHPGVARIVTVVATLSFGAYAYYVAAVDSAYLIAILYYLPASLALTLAFLMRAVRSRQRPAWLGLAGLGLTFVAAGVQQAGLGLHPRYFNHNALYHLIQAIGLFLFYKGARWLPDQAILFKGNVGDRAEA